ncbi:hypothetical protein BDP55DRAFT_767722 [Colletotrichum godetiae]|uniref:Uncharacterized protein n=1 Tax=Colletotrichum godetiae TaxID=1209918 RepID=A0AAJ0AM89_9PEZI|nr:uncharacterized protein BDP55DRAFT_767722 [Colletotrichum godetiae]KAK1676482.1 hypothetical protein BDP55DRAFT_767722 [Colletotrichum godetiae]
MKRSEWHGQRSHFRFLIAFVEDKERVRFVPCAMATPNSIKAAREAVANIAKEHGYVAQDKLQKIPLELRREIEQAFFWKDQMIGSSVIILAKNLYSSKARFVFELL